MAKLNLLISLNSFADAQSSNNPSMSFFKWTREVLGLQVSDSAESKGYSVAAGETKTLFDNRRALAQDGTTQHTLTLQSGTTYRLTKSAGAGSFSAAQVGDSLILGSAFLLANRGTFAITAVNAAYVEFASAAALTPEANITAQVTVYSSAKTLVYVEANKKATATINAGEQTSKIEPFVIGTDIKPGMLLVKTTAYELSVKNDDAEAAQVYLASVE
jgi:hypothetical protein